MRLVKTVEALREARAALTGRVGVVPTMGALHAGHMALVEAARAENDAVLVTIFVNPTQFAPGTDFERYPRDLERDLRLLDAAGVDVVFAPAVGEIYPPGFQTTVTVSEVSRRLEGERRPGHFEGVATVVAKLFNLTQPTVAYFGQKDAQQVVVIRRMARDLNFPLTIAVCPTVREADGLALSSRNVYLSPEEREKAATLARALRQASECYDQGERDPDALRGVVTRLLEAVPGMDVDYVSLADPRTLEEQMTPTDAPLLLSAVARFGTTRLLDNTLLPSSLNTRAGLDATLGAV